MSFNLTQNIRRHGFKRLLLAVSGGVDSICLAHYFICNKEAFGIEWLGIAHVHHGLRKGTADRDAEFVEAFARKYNVPFFLKKLDGEALKNAEGSLEENARDARYKALAEIVQDDAPHTSSIIHHQSSIIVTAHHAGDQAETRYMRIRRGTTLAGLRGIQEIRVLGNSQGVAGGQHLGACSLVRMATKVGLASEAPLEGVMEDRATGCNQGDTSPHIINHQSLIINHQSNFIYRPFLNMTREELLTYARENNLEWCEDESNDDVTFARNKVRHDLLPHLEQECPGATEQLCRIAGIADRAYAKVMETNKKLFASTVVPPETRRVDSIASTRLQNDIPALTLDKKKLNKILREHADADLSEMFRLWLSEQGLRFPIGFFYSPKEPAHVKIPVRAAYRKRSVAKIGRTVRICEFSTPEEAQKFVSCE